MHSYYIRQLLEPSEAAHIVSSLNQDHIGWRDGRETLLNVSVEDGSWDRFAKYKINMEACHPKDELNELRNIIWNRLDRDAPFLHDVVADQSGAPLFTKTNVGGYYSPHHDNPINGHYSTTIFLSDPSEYDGGELCLSVNGESRSFKLDAGWAITYKTGTPHCVTEVTRGTRTVSVFWTKSKIGDDEDREWYSDIVKALDLIPVAPLDSKRDLDEALKDPGFILQGLRDKMLRRYSKEGRYSN